METLDCIRTRRSIRKYLDQPVEWEKIVNILDAGRFAPTSGNIQNFKLIAIKEKPNKKLVSKACHDQKWIEDASVIIVIIGEPHMMTRFYGLRGEHFYTIQNATAVIENMLLAANDQGLGSCWVGAFDDDLLRRAIKCPEADVPIGVVTIGYPAEDPDMPPRTEIQHLVFLENYGGRRKLPMRGYYGEKMQQTINRTKDAADRSKLKIKDKIKAKIDEIKEKRASK